MSTNDLLALRDALRMSSCPSRALDKEVALAFGWQCRTEGKGNGKRRMWRNPHEGVSPWCEETFGWPRLYTKRLDEAIKLLPRTEGGNLAGVLHAAFHQLHIGDIPDEKIAIAVVLKAVDIKLVEEAHAEARLELANAGAS